MLLKRSQDSGRSRLTGLHLFRHGIRRTRRPDRTRVQRKSLQTLVRIHLTDVLRQPALRELAQRVRDWWVTLCHVRGSRDNVDNRPALALEQEGDELPRRVVRSVQVDADGAIPVLDRLVGEHGAPGAWTGFAGPGVADQSIEPAVVFFFHVLAELDVRLILLSVTGDGGDLDLVAKFRGELVEVGFRLFERACSATSNHDATGFRLDVRAGDVFTNAGGATGDNSDEAFGKRVVLGRDGVCWGITVGFGDFEACR